MFVISFNEKMLSIQGLGESRKRSVESCRLCSQKRSVRKRVTLETRARRLSNFGLLPLGPVFILSLFQKTSMVSEDAVRKKQAKYIHPHLLSHLFTHFKFKEAIVELILIEIVPTLPSELKKGNISDRVFILLFTRN